ncbi:MAG: hypothetical protein K9L86_08155 [Candidatus Omnitrophica bacterium]|nr:hypothetical protein [Candidatus Omnitrophota bacterium]
MRKLLIILTLFCLIGPYQAQGFSLVVKPPSLEIISNPGGSRSFILRLTNSGSDGNLKAKVYIETVYMSEDGELVFLEPSDDPKGVGNWIEVRDKIISLKPLATKKIPLRLRVPAGTPSGGYYAAVMFEPIGEEETTQKGLKVAFRLASLLQITVKGSKPLIKQAEVNDFFYFSGPIDSKSLTEVEANGLKGKVVKEFPNQKGSFFAALVKNTGNVHFRGEATVLIMTKDKKRKGEVTLRSGKGMVYANAGRYFIGHFPNTLAAGDYIAQLRLSYRGPSRLVKEFPFSVKVAQFGQESQGNLLSALEVIPKDIKIETVSGVLRSQQYTLLNRLDKELNLKLSASGQIKDWFELVYTNLKLPSAREKNFIFRLQIPKEVSEGFYRGMIIFEDSQQGVKEDLPIEVEIKRR